MPAPRSNPVSSATELFFRFGPESRRTDGFPLVWLNGGIMADTGSEKSDYLFQNQFRYPVYAAMIHMRPLLLVHDEKQIFQYYECLEQIKTDMSILNSYVDPFLSLSFADPLFLPCHMDTQPFELSWTPHLRKQLNTPGVVIPHAADGICLNQISPTVVTILQRLYKFMAMEGFNLDVDLSEYLRMGHNALFWHHKDTYIDLLASRSDKTTIPAHIPSAVIRSDRLKTLTWEQMSFIFNSQTNIPGTDTFFIKSNIDAAGEVAASIRKDNFRLKIAAIRKDLQDKIRLMGRKDAPIKIIIQPYIQRYDTGSQPSSIGITYNIFGDHDIRRVAVIGHVYEDPGHQTFIGSYASKHHTHEVLTRIGEDKIFNLMRLFARKGYRGPVNLDAVRDRKNNYVFIYDCNPRLGGSFPGIALERALTAQGHCIQSVLTLGYRGRFVFPDLPAKLEELAGLGLLYTRHQPRGLCLIPSFVRPNSYDFALINTPFNQLQEILASGVLDNLSDKNQKDLKGVYL